MRQTRVARLATLLFGLFGIVIPGCKSCLPWGGKVADSVPGLTPPAEQIAALKKLAKEAGSKGPAEQEQAAAELATRYARETDPLIRAEIVRTLGEYRVGAALAGVCQAAKDSEPDVRVVACKALARQKGPDATLTLREMLAGDVDVDVRLAAARALGEIRDPEAVPTLGAALEDRDPAMQYRAVSSLRSVAPEDLGNDVERWRQYVKGETPGPPKSVSLVERIRRILY